MAPPPWGPAGPPPPPLVRLCTATRLHNLPPHGAAAMEASRAATSPIAHSRAVLGASMLCSSRTPRSTGDTSMFFLQQGEKSIFRVAQGRWQEGEWGAGGTCHAAATNSDSAGHTVLHYDAYSLAHASMSAAQHSKDECVGSGSSRWQQLAYLYSRNSMTSRSYVTPSAATTAVWAGVGRWVSERGQ